MPRRTVVLVAHVDIVEPTVSKQDLEELAQSLRAELLLLDVDDATWRPSQFATPVGARGFDAGDVGALLVALESSLPLVAAVVKTIQAWLSRAHVPNRTVRVTIGDKSVELSNASGEQQDQLVHAFLQAVAR
jgi:hypothetical protein